MPHNYIFGQNFSHHVVGDRMEDQLAGHTNGLNVVGMKRKEAWLGLEAGNFEFQKEDGGPTCKKRVKVSPDDIEEAHDRSDSNGTLAANVTHENSPQICHSMVAHMAMSYRNQNQQMSNPLENVTPNITFAENQIPYDVDMECAVSMDDITALQPTVDHMEDTSWYGRSCAIPSYHATSTGTWWEEIVVCCHGS